MDTSLPLGQYYYGHKNEVSVEDFFSFVKNPINKDKKFEFINRRIVLMAGAVSENHNIIVPNNAIRTDTNGDFVLVVIPRTSPLGNRYIATRADVNILATDDTHTAVTGALTGWDFVITTSSSPIDPGMQVRLVDNP